MLKELAGELTAEFGNGFSKSNLASTVRFADVFHDLKIVQSLITQLGWTHFKSLIPIDDTLKREFTLKCAPLNAPC
ncbi:MAG: hypothetical protein JW883_16360 [Deltaproteobacteria bacterium]|nr:hypothetical protein [Deltaproteobacteria bacterium]